MSYSSFAERGRFDPIQVGDKTQEMVRSSSKYLDAMRENNRIDIERKKELLQAIKERMNKSASIVKLTSELNNSLNAQLGNKN